MKQNVHNSYNFIVDFEATCFERPYQPDLNEIIDIGIVLCDNEFNIIYKWTKLVKPSVNKKLSRFCRNLTNIMQEDIDKAECFVNVVSLFQREFEAKYGMQTNAVAWYSWGDWDLKCLIRNCERNNVAFPFGDYKNLRNVYIKICNNGFNANSGLRDVLLKQNISDISQHHRALNDAEGAAKIAKFMCDSFHWRTNEGF
jgi:inhibitor of KinA sporulation pathway (predicted exonuclease)